MNLVEFCRQLTAIDSSLSHGTRDIAEFVAEQARKNGLQADIQYENLEGVANANVVLRLENSKAMKNLLLVSRMDTINPGEYGYWVRTGANPFNASLDGDNIYGLGLSDAKADLACKMQALLAFKDSAYSQISPAVLGTYGLGSGSGAIRFIRKKAVPIAATVVGAPTDLQLAGKGPGYAKVEISIPFTDAERKYIEQHDLVEASVSQSKIFSKKEGPRVSLDLLDNPIVRLIDYLKNIPRGMTIISVEGGVNYESEPDSAMLELDLIDGIGEGVNAKLIAVGESLKRVSAELKTVHDDGFEPAYSTITIGMVRTFPEEIKISGVCRLVPSTGRDVYEKWLERLRQDCAHAGTTFHVLDYKPPFVVPQDGAFFSFLKRVSSDFGLNEATVAARRCTEANVFQRLGIESAVIGPGSLVKPSHASQEHVRTQDLEKATMFYKKLIESYCR